MEDKKANGGSINKTTELVGEHKEGYPNLYVKVPVLIGNLLDRWEMTPNDLKEDMREFGCGRQLDALFMYYFEYELE